MSMIGAEQSNYLLSIYEVGISQVVIGTHFHSGDTLSLRASYLYFQVEH